MPQSEESKKIILEIEQKAEKIFQDFLAANGAATTAQLRDLGKDDQYIAAFWNGYREDVRKLALAEYQRCLARVILTSGSSSSNVVPISQHK